jgi:hypothetical protein
MQLKRRRMMEEMEGGTEQQVGSALTREPA